MTLKSKIKYPLAIKWKIAKNKLQKLRNSIDGCLKSEFFEFPGTDVGYYISIYPNGHNEEHRGITLIFLTLIFEEQKEIEAEFFININNAKVSDKFEVVCEKSRGLVVPMCTVEELFDPKEKNLVDGHMRIGIEGFLMVEVDQKKLKFEGGSDTLGMELWNQDNKDFIIDVDGKEIEAHKNVLSTRSPVFEAMLKPHTKEAQENRVTIPDFSFDVVEAAIKLCYHSSLVGEISLDDAMGFLQFFEKYDIQSLKADLENHLISAISEINVCDLINSSIDSNSPKLKFKCTEFLRECLDQHKPINDFETLNKEFVFNFFKNSFSRISL